MNADEVVAVLYARADVQTVVTDIEMPGSMSRLELPRVVQEPWPGIRGCCHIRDGTPRPDLSEKVAFLSKPYLPDTVIKGIRQMATPQVVEAASANVANSQKVVYRIALAMRSIEAHV